MLYNLGPAQAAARKAGTVIVTEGYVDVIALAQAGLDNAVAGLGTAITEHHLAALWKLAPEPVVALDGDAAGLAAAHRLIDLALPLLGPGRALRFALMPSGQDPDDVVRGGGAAAMHALLDASRPIVDLVWTRETEGQVLDSPERRAGLDARLRAHLARIADPSIRAHWERENPRPPRRPLRAGTAGCAARRPAAAPRPRPAGRRPVGLGQGVAPRPPARRRPGRGPHPRERHPRRLPHPSAGRRTPSRIASSASRSAAATSPRSATPSCPRSTAP